MLLPVPLAVKVFTCVPPVVPGGTAKTSLKVHEPGTGNTVPTWQSASPANVPNLSSVRRVIVKGTLPVLFTT